MDKKSNVIQFRKTGGSIHKTGGSTLITHITHKGHIDCRTGADPADLDEMEAYMVAAAVLQFCQRVGNKVGMDAIEAHINSMRGKEDG